MSFKSIVMFSERGKSSDLKLLLKVLNQKHFWILWHSLHEPSEELLAVGNMTIDISNEKISDRTSKSAEIPWR
jgi:hypothetical protein